MRRLLWWTIQTTRCREQQQQRTMRRHWWMMRCLEPRQPTTRRCKSTEARRPTRRRRCTEARCPTRRRQVYDDEMSGGAAGDPAADVPEPDAPPTVHGGRQALRRPPLLARRCARKSQTANRGCAALARAFRSFRRRPPCARNTRRCARKRRTAARRCATRRPRALRLRRFLPAQATPMTLRTGRCRSARGGRRSRRRARQSRQRGRRRRERRREADLEREPRMERQRRLGGSRRAAQRKRFPFCGRRP